MISSTLQCSVAATVTGLMFNLCLILLLMIGTNCNAQQGTLTMQSSHLQPPTNNNLAANNVFHHDNNNRQSATVPTTQQQQQNHRTNGPPLARPNLSSQEFQLNTTTAHQNDIPESAADWLMLGAEDLDLGEGKRVAAFMDGPRNNITATKRSGHKRKSSSAISKQGTNRTSTGGGATFDDEQMSSDSSESEMYDEENAEGSTLAGTVKQPECASQGRYYCTYKEDYPNKLVTEVTKYYKWPLEKLFRDLHAQIMPKLAQDSTGNLVCDSVTRVVRPGWARNTNDRWLVVINTENYHQYVTEVVCQYGPNSRCNFIPPCYYSSCQQRYNTQKLLVIDPTNPYRGPFLSEFLFPSCCVCYVPSTSESIQDKYRSSPATIYQRTLQQEAASNLYPPQFKPTGLLENLPSSFIEQSTGGSSVRPTLSSQQAVGSMSLASNKISVTPASAAAAGRVLAPGEIRRTGEQYKRHSNGQGDTSKGD